MTPQPSFTHTANVRFQLTRQICRVYISYMNVYSTVRYRQHPCTPRHAHPSMIFRACVFVEYPPLVVKTLIFRGFHRQKGVSVLPFCSLRQDFPSSAPLCLSATPTSSRQLRSPAFNQSASIKTPALHTLTARGFFACQTLWFYFPA